MSGPSGPTTEDLAHRLRDWPGPRPGGRLVVLIDGRSGAGKTSLARALAETLDAETVHVEDFFHGWHGLAAGTAEVRDHVLAPLAAGRVPEPARYDWHAERVLDRTPLPVAAGRTLIVEGCGAGLAAPAFTAPDVLASVLVWLDAPVEARRPRALARDEGRFDPYWDLWAGVEDAFYARWDVAHAADVVLRT